MKVILLLCFTDAIVCHYNVNIDVSGRFKRKKEKTTHI